VASYLGFQDSHFREDIFAPADGEEFLSDADTFPLLYEEYRKAADAGTPYFGFTVTYQNHGPYASDCLDNETAEYVGQDGLSEEAYYTLTITSTASGRQTRPCGVSLKTSGTSMSPW
jgi:phosphoglycerol transferase MdoB-like AlkP superfamily enzyme